MPRWDPGRWTIELPRTFASLGLLAALLASPSAAAFASVGGVDGRGAAWGGVAMGYGSLTRRSAAESRAIDTFVLDFLGGVPVTSRIRCGIKLGGWLIESGSPVSGRSFSSVLALAEIQPRTRHSPFLRLGGGVALYDDAPNEAHASGWGGTAGLGWDLAKGPRTLAPLILEFSWGRPGDAGRSDPNLRDLRYRAVSLTLGLEGIAFPRALKDTSAVFPDLGARGGFRIQGGGHSVTGKLGVLPPGVVDGHEFGNGILAGLTFEVEHGRGHRYGVGMALEGSRINLGVQSFGIATVRAAARTELEWAFLGSRASYDPRPYFLLGAGWNFNAAGEKVSYPLGAPPGTATRLELDDSPALTLGLGADFPVRPGFALNAETGWNWNSSRYRMTVAGSPDRTGDCHLSGLFLAVGIAPGRIHGAR